MEMRHISEYLEKVAGSGLKQPRYPVYIVSKGRWRWNLTSKALTRMGVGHRVVVEPQEFDAYAAALGAEKLLVLPFSNLGQGSIPARNWIWQHTLDSGADRHWILDDNIQHFCRRHLTSREPVLSPYPFRCIEDWTDRYENVYLAGMNYVTFARDTIACPPLRFNTRVYSCILIDNHLPFRWRGRYNEDTDLSLRVLKSGGCTALFNAFLADKVKTMRMRGGNTDELYADNGRLKMAQSLVDQHPDVTTVTHRWGRPQHRVDYRPFRNNLLVRRADYAERVAHAEPDPLVLEHVMMR
jgi:hypothetical protein